MVSSRYRDPVYNLKAVVERTGVGAHALRAWERRYGLPHPARTDGGHRIYSQRDIDVIKWLVTRQDEGLRIGRAVKLWRSLEDEGQNPLQAMPAPRRARRTPLADGATLAELREAWLSSSLAFDERGAEEALTRAFALYPPEVVCTQIVAQGIAEGGRRWFAGGITVQQEHFASELAVRRLETLITATPLPTRRGRFLAACPSGEEHTLGLLTMTLLVRRAGWDVVYLGANVPLAQMERTMEDVRPDLIILAAQQLHTAVNLLDVARFARQREMGLAFGGRVFDQEPGVRKRIPGHFLGPTLDQAVPEAELLMTTARPTPVAEVLSEAEEEALIHFRERRMALESEVWHAIRVGPYEADVLRRLNKTFGQAIEGALTFGDMDLFGRQLDWLEGLDERDRPALPEIDRYLHAYRDAADKQLDQRGATVATWLGERLRKARGTEATLDRA